VLESCFVYITDIDVSRDNAAGINERAFVKSIAAHDEVICVLPAPIRPQVYYDPKIEYVLGHRRNPFLYPLHLLAAALRILQIRRRYEVKAFVLRLGLMPIVPLIYSYLFDIPLLLKSHSGYKPLERVPWKDIVIPNTRWKRRNLKVRIANVICEPVRAGVVRRVVMADSPSSTCRELVHRQSGIDKERLFVVPNGADTELFHPRDRDECRVELDLCKFGRIVGYVGALNADKRWLDILIKSMAILNKSECVGCVIVGDGPDRINLEQLSRDEGIAEKILFTGSVPSKKVPRYIGAFDVAVDLCAAPMRVAGTRVYSSYSQKMAQYLACGRPVVAWDIEDNQGIVEYDVGRLAELFSAKDLVEKLQSLLFSSAGSQEAIRRRAREYAEEHLSYSVLAERRLQLWQRVLTAYKLN